MIDLFKINKKKKDPESKLMIEANENLIKERLINRENTYNANNNNQEVVSNTNNKNIISDEEIIKQLNLSHVDVRNELNVEDANEPYSTTLENNKNSNSISLDRVIEELKMIRSQNDYIIDMLRKIERRLE